MTSVAHVITSLDVGGAERTLVNLAPGLRERGLRQLVVCLLPPGSMAGDLERRGVPVHSLHLRPDAVLRRGVPGAAALARLLRRAAPDVVQTWMYHADVLGGLAARAVGRGAVVWNVRHADLPLEGYGALTAAVGRLSVPASRLLPRRIVTNSVASLEAHVARGYPRPAMRLVPNGVAVPSGPGPTRAEARAALGLPGDGPIVGRVGRAHAQKDLPTFLRAVALLRERMPGVRAALVGRGTEPDDARLGAWIREAGLEGAVHRCGPRVDAPGVQAAFDLSVSSSAYGETCPNTILEAMAAGVAVVTTDVGDSARIVGDTGAVVPPRDPSALAAAMARLLDLPPADRARRGAAARDRVRLHFSIAAMVEGYDAVYREMLASAGARAA